MPPISPFPRTLFKWESAPLFYTVALSKRLRCYDGVQSRRYFVRHELVYMDVVSALCEGEAVFEAAYHHFSGRLTHRWQTGRVPLSAQDLAKIDVFANSLAFSFFKQIGTPGQILFAESGRWHNNHGPEFVYEKSA